MGRKNKTPKTQNQLGNEAIAAAFLVFGAVAFMITFFPLLNPRQYELNFNPSGEAPTLTRYCIGMIVTVLIFAIAYHFNRKAKSD